MSNDINEKIKAALINDTNSPEFDADDTMRDLLRTSFRGRMRFWAYFAYAYLILFTILAVLFGYWFFESQSVKNMILYGGLFGISILIITVVKLWYWMLINRNAVTREIKRLEFQIAKLAEVLSEERV